MELLLTLEQQQAIKPISENKAHVFNQLINDVQLLYLPKLLGDTLFQQVTTTPDDYTDLLGGSDFEYCGSTIHHMGVRAVLAYYFYAEYVKSSDFEDTFTGFVRQNRGETEHLSTKKIDKIVNFNVQIAEQMFQNVRKYITTVLQNNQTSSIKVTSPRILTI